MLRDLFRARSLLLALTIGGVMSAQTPTVTANDYLKEVRVFAPGSAEFAKIASALGVDATLPTLGAGAQLVAAIRNDSGGTVELRILFQLTKGGKTTPRDLQLNQTLQAGESTLVAPREVNGALAGLLNAGKPGLHGFTGSPTVQPLDDYQGATAYVSVDSATLADGKFVGADTQNYFDRLVENDARQKSFFSDLAAQSKTLSAAEIKQMLSERQTAAASDRKKSSGMANFPLGAQTEYGLCVTALAQLEHFGMAALSTWADRENAKQQAKPTLHK